MGNSNDINSMYQSAFQLASSGNVEQAIIRLKCCISLNPQLTDALLLLANIYIQTSQFELALDAYKRARRINKFKLEAIAGIAKIYRLQGDVDLAYQFIIKEVSANTLSISIILSFAQICLELERYSEAIQKIEALLNSNIIIAVSDKKDLLHTLGKHYDKNKNYKQAFLSHKQANELNPNQYDRQRFESIISRIQASYSKDFLKSCNHSTIKNKQPVFIVGMPRSGTSLLEQIMSSHSQIHGAGELATIQKLIASMCKGQYPEQMRNIDSKTLTNSAQQYINEACSKVHAYTTDKMPHNYLHLGVIHQLFPDSKIITVNRDPIDNCLSIYFQCFKDSHRYATGLSSIAHHYNGYHNLSNYWKKQFPDNIIDINYEDIVSNTQHEISRILDALELEWQDSCPQSHKNKRHVLTASQQQVNKPIYMESISRWKHYEAYISPLLSDLKSYNLI